ncbi:MAG: response regulator [Planctomycetes bacterium]|nr:response regulator [Planctomycetota bacterium]
MNEPTAVCTANALIVEDEAPIRRFLRTALAARGYRVDEADTLQAARLQVTARPPDVVLLDLGLPDGDGIELVHEIRGWSQLPIVVLSARDQESVKVAALDAGADDFLTKPFGVPELLARLRVVLRRRARSEVDEVPVVTCRGSDGRGFRLDLARRQCHLLGEGGADVKLTPTEFRLLATLARHAGRVLTHTALLREVWGPNHDGDLAYLRVFMGQLRHKLEPEPAVPRWLLTEPGVGYRLGIDPVEA